MSLLFLLISFCFPFLAPYTDSSHPTLQSNAYHILLKNIKTNRVLWTLEIHLFPCVIISRYGQNMIWITQSKPPVSVIDIYVHLWLVLLIFNIILSIVCLKYMWNAFLTEWENVTARSILIRAANREMSGVYDPKGEINISFSRLAVHARRWRDGFKAETPVCFSQDLKQVCYTWLCLPGKNNPFIAPATLAQQSLSLAVY